VKRGESDARMADNLRTVEEMEAYAESVTGAATTDAVPQSRQRRRLTQWVEDLSPNDKAIYAVLITGHYVAVQRGIVVDTYMPWGQLYAHRNSFVKQAWRVERPA
jgi:hypothetical protein